MSVGSARAAQRNQVHLHVPVHLADVFALAWLATECQLQPVLHKPPQRPVNLVPAHLQHLGDLLVCAPAAQHRHQGQFQIRRHLARNATLAFFRVGFAQCLGSNRFTDETRQQHDRQHIGQGLNSLHRHFA